jgi:hypothetical protein
MTSIRDQLAGIDDSPVQFTVRLPPALYERLRLAVISGGAAKRDVVIAALEEYLADQGFGPGRLT